MPLGLETFARAAICRARKGLYAGRGIGFGNKVSEDGGNKSRRTWKPNTHWKQLYSEILDENIRVRVTTHALRCIDKKGGLDNYILQTKEAELASDKAMEIKQRLLRALQEKLAPASRGIPAYR